MLLSRHQPSAIAKKLDFEIDKNLCSLHNRKYVHSQGIYVGNTDLAVNNGVYTIEIKKQNFNNKSKIDSVVGETEYIQSDRGDHKESLSVTNKGYYNSENVMMIQISNDENLYNLSVAIS